MIKYVFFTIFIITFFLNTSTNNTIIQEKYIDSIKKGEEKSNICSPCHGKDGNSLMPAWPKIAGQFSTYLHTQLQIFKKNNKDERINPLMYNIVKDLTNEDFINLSNYYSKQKQTKGVLKDKIKFENGKIIFHYGNKENNTPACASCHGSKGQGNELAGYPKLRAQHKEYIIQQLENYKTMQRKTDTNEIMRDIAKKLTNEQMQNVAEYINSM